RTTNLTREGETFFEHCNRGVSQIADAVNNMLDLRQGPPRGSIRVCASVAFGRNVIAPLIFKFSEIYPEIEVDLLLEDRPACLAGKQIDVAFRDGHIEDSNIIAKRLVAMQMVLCASRSYVEKRGLPATLEELRRHDCVNLRLPGGRVSE